MQRRDGDDRQEEGEGAAGGGNNWFKQRANQLSTKLTVISSDIGHRLADFVSAIQQQLSSDSEGEEEGQGKDIGNRLTGLRGHRGKRSRRNTADRRPCTVWLLGVRYGPLLMTCEPGSGELTAAVVTPLSPSTTTTESLEESSTAAAGTAEQEEVHRQQLGEYLNEWALLQRDFRSRIWLTYRHNFPAITAAQHYYTSDVGWGCMIRCGQSMLAQGLVMHLLGRDWRLGSRGEQDEQWRIYENIIKGFLDEPERPFSIHQITRCGWEECQVAVGKCQSKNLLAYVAQDLGTIYREQVEELFEQSSAAVLILIPTRLGIDEINPAYYPAILDALTLPQSIGIAGGKPNSALYFCGADQTASSLIYLDPHLSRLALNGRMPLKMDDYLSFHCEQMRRIHLKSVDPSLLFGFYCNGSQQFRQLCQSLAEISTNGFPIISIGDRPPPIYHSDLEHHHNDDSSEDDF